MAARVFAWLLGAAFVLLLMSPAFGVPAGALGGLIAVVPAFAAARGLITSPEVTQRIVPAQRLTLVAFVVYAVGVSAGLPVT